MSSNAYSYSTEDYIYNITNINSEYINIVAINKSNMKIINETIKDIKPDDLSTIFSLDSFYNLLKKNIMSVVEDIIVFNYTSMAPDTENKINLKTIKFEDAKVINRTLTYKRYVETDLEAKTRIENMMKEKDNKIKEKDERINELENKIRTNEDIERIMREKDEKIKELEDKMRTNEDIERVMKEKNERINYLEEKIKKNIKKNIEEEVKKIEKEEVDTNVIKHILVNDKLVDMKEYLRMEYYTKI
jgi:hypothetical protein